MSEEEMAERIFQLEKELNKKNNEIEILESRLKHLLKSKFISLYDARDSKTGEYIYNIEDVDYIGSVEEEIMNHKISKYVLEDKLIVGYDLSDDKDHTCLIVCRQMKNGYLLLNNYCDEEADKLYKKLTERSEIKNGVSITD